MAPRLVVVGGGSTAPIVDLDGKRREGGGMWFEVDAPGRRRDVRDRIGVHASTVLFGGEATTISSARARRFRLLNSDQLWTVYLRTPDVRSSIDGIARRIATWDHETAVALDPSDDEHEEALQLAAEVDRFLDAPNDNGETWQELLTKWITDLLAYDAGAIEIVSNKGGDKLSELVALRGSSIHPVVDDKGRVASYEQDVTELGGESAVESPPSFETEQLVYTMLFPNTASPEGNPIIEAIITEVATMLRQAEHVLLAVDADEVPPGVLVLMGFAGKAARSAKKDLERLKGRDHKLRVLTVAEPTATGAKWVEVSRRLKDVDLKEVIREVRRTIWRAFGVLPIEQGESENIPRAVGAVQLEVSSSHLINPILELLAAKINARIIPPLVRSLLADSGFDEKEVERRVGWLLFGFDLDARLSSGDKKDVASADATYLDRGVKTINEVRAEMGRPPFEAGDVPTVSTPAGPVPLASVVPSDDDEPPPEDEEEPPPDDGDDGGDGGVEDAPAPEDGDAGPGEASLLRLVRDGDDDDDGAVERSPACRLEDETVDECVSRKIPEILEENPGMEQDQAVAIAHSVCETPCEECRQVAFDPDDLPSDWQPSGRFRDVRTVDLARLGGAVAAYTRDVLPLWRRAQSDVEGMFAAAHDPDGLTDAAAEALRTRVSGRLDQLAADWTLTTSGRYRDASRVGRDAAVEHAGPDVVADWQARGEAFSATAMLRLVEPNGVLSDVRADLLGIVGAVARSRAEDVRAPAPLPAVGPGDEFDVLLPLVTKAWARNEHRVDNWAGRLVQLSNEVMAEGVAEGGGRAGVEWWAEWVNVGDERTCPTCDDLGSSGFVLLATMPTVPGGDTECRARCRCVLVLWERGEVDDGSAQLLGGGNAP